MAQTLLSEQKSTAGSPYMFYIYKNGQWTLNKGYIYRDGAWVRVKNAYVCYGSNWHRC